jgi:hypothetical protein
MVEVDLPINEFISAHGYLKEQNNIHLTLAYSQ